MDFRYNRLDMNSEFYFIRFSASFLLLEIAKKKKMAEAKRYLRQSLWFLSEGLGWLAATL